MGKIPLLLAEFLAELDQLSEANEKLKFILSLSEELPSFAEDEKASAQKVSGCASNVYLISEYREGKMYFRGTADAQIPKGFLALFVLGCSGSTPEEILSISDDILDQAKLKNLLSPSRANGSYQIFKKIQEEARKFI